MAIHTWSSVLFGTTKQLWPRRGNQNSVIWKQIKCQRVVSISIGLNFLICVTKDNMTRITAQNVVQYYSFPGKMNSSSLPVGNPRPTFCFAYPHPSFQEKKPAHKLSGATLHWPVRWGEWATWQKNRSLGCLFLCEDLFRPLKPQSHTHAQTHTNKTGVVCPLTVFVKTFLHV